MTKVNKIVELLKKEQIKLRDKFKAKITSQKKSIYDFRGVWIAVSCACGHDFKTPFWIRDNGICPKCKKLFCRALKKEMSDKA